MPPQQRLDIGRTGVVERDPSHPALDSQAACGSSGLRRSLRFCCSCRRRKRRRRTPLQRYAEGTWASFVAMTDEQSGLPADTLKADGTRSVQTSTTNIGAYMWSALVAERLGIIGHRETVERLGPR